MGIRAVKILIDRPPVLRLVGPLLFGDPSSNATLAKILAGLPLQWDAKQIVFRGQTYDAAHTQFLKPYHTR